MREKIKIWWINLPSVTVGKWRITPASWTTSDLDGIPLIDKQPDYLSIRAPFSRHNVCFRKVRD